MTDRVSKGEVSIKWCPTADMVGDFATKPLQGALFKRFRDQIMGVVPVDVSSAKKTAPKELGGKVSNKKGLASQKETPQECVGGSFAEERGHGSSHSGVWTGL